MKRVGRSSGALKFTGRDSRASALFVSAALYPVVAPVLDDNPWLRTVVVVGGAAPDGTTGFDDFMADTRPLIAAMSARMMWPSGFIHRVRQANPRG